MGIYLCYSDHLHKHFLEPRDMVLMVEFANGILRGVKRKVNYIHMPVPKGRVDEGYFAPLKGLTLREETELFLGLAHGWYEEGTRRGIEAAKGFVKGFDVATECGMKRILADEFESVLEGLVTVYCYIELPFGENKYTLTCAKSQKPKAPPRKNSQRRRKNKRPQPKLC